MAEKMEKPASTENSWKDYFRVGEVFGYFFRKNNPKPENQSSRINLKMMHGVNKLSMIMFLVGIIVFIISKVF